MTVEELIKELQQLDRSTTVLVGDSTDVKDKFKIENRHALYYFQVDEWEILHPADAEHWLTNPEIDRDWETI